MSMSVVTEFTFVSKSATTLTVPITASATMATGSAMMAMHAKVSKIMIITTITSLCDTLYNGDDMH